MSRRKDAGAETAAMRAVEEHHAAMLEELSGLAASLVESVGARDSAAEERARSALLGWCAGELVPHALAEEGPLYSGPGSDPEARLLVDGMLSEHKVIVALVEELRRSRGVPAAVAGDAIRRIFALHLDKENRLLMPFIVQSPTMVLADAVSGLHELVGEHGHDHRDAPSTG
ncbi:hemerythrin domain-containing protein [Arthrobacter sp. NPDC092385]|uniref:hemerythrin domain-containing protein n=1 Tax=Arthrobacter sp. NPDC092385 TaxID=3363943 RepID=UPI0038036630